MPPCLELCLVCQLERCMRAKGHAASGGDGEFCICPACYREGRRPGPPGAHIIHPPGQGGAGLLAKRARSDPGTPSTQPVAATADKRQSPAAPHSTMQLGIGPVQVHRGTVACGLTLGASSEDMQQAVLARPFATSPQGGAQLMAKHAQGDMGTPSTQPVVATASKEQPSAAYRSTMQLDLGAVTVHDGSIDRHSQMQGHTCSSRRKFSLGLGKEFSKHRAYREVNGMVTEIGWLYSKALSDKGVPKMSARMKDLLHIIWLYFEKHGIDPEFVNQIWHLDQSLIRGEWEKDSLYQQLPHIPGLGLRRQGGITAAVLPNSCMWANGYMRFLSGVDMLQLQGVPIRQLSFLSRRRTLFARSLLEICSACLLWGGFF